MEEMMEEYVTFHVTAKDGSDVEMAVVDEFDFEEKHYVVGAVVKDDTIDDEGRYIYECIMDGDDFTVQQIKKEFGYRRVANVYGDGWGRVKLFQYHLFDVAFYKTVCYSKSALEVSMLSVHVS